MNAIESLAMFDLDSWAPPPRKLTLTEGEIHLWRAFLDCEGPQIREFHSTLAPEERERATRYFFQTDKNHFVVTRGVLRDLLSKYVGCTAVEIQFEYGPQGKPSLRPEFLRQPIRFNVSHSHGLALFAFAIGRDLGVDVELMRGDFGGVAIAERYFAAEEVQELRALPPALSAEGFFLCWTRKEAYIKARGEGLQVPLESFHVSLTPGQPERLYSADMNRWSLRSLRPNRRYVGALVGEGQGWSLSYWDWRPFKSG